MFLSWIRLDYLNDVKLSETELSDDMKYIVYSHWQSSIYMNLFFSEKSKVRAFWNKYEFDSHGHCGGCITKEIALVCQSVTVEMNISITRSAVQKNRQSALIVLFPFVNHLYFIFSGKFSLYYKSYGFQTS